MTLAQPTHRYTPEEYLNREQNAVERHQYYEGEIFAMSGGSISHSLIIANAIHSLIERLRGSPCRVFDSNLRISVARTTLYTYPDVSVVCGPPETDPRDPRGETVLNPTLLVEVLSPSTEAYDRGAKFQNYQRIDSLREYLLVSQDVARAETFLRQSDGSWVYTSVTGLDAAITLASLNVRLSLADVYAGVTFPPPPAEEAT